MRSALRIVIAAASLAALLAGGRIASSPAAAAQAPRDRPTEEELRRAQDERQRSGDRRSRRVRMERVVVASPDGRVAFTLLPNAERLTFTVTLDGRTVIEPSPVELTVDGVDLGSGLIFGSVETDAVDESFAWHGAHATARHRSHGARVELVSDLGKLPFVLEARAFDDGVAYRLVVDEMEQRTKAKGGP